VKNSFFLIIPPQRKSAEHSKPFKESALRQWVEQLPTANPSLATRLFHDIVVDFNQIEMESTARLEALEILRPSYIIIEDYLRSRLMQSSFPKTAGDQKIMDILIAIEREFTLSYWMVVRDLTRKEGNWFQSRNIARSIQRSIKGLGAIIVTFCMMYRPIPDWVWMDCHALYKLAETLNKQTIKVPAEFNHSAKTTTIATSYRQILLFSLAQPSRLMQKEMHQLYHFLETISFYLRIDPQAAANQSTQCLLKMDEDKPPFFQDDEPTLSDSSVRYLNFDKLFKVFNYKYKSIDPGLTRFSAMEESSGNEAKLSLDLFYLLEQRWKAQPLPETGPFADRLDRVIALGLDAAFNLQRSALEQDVEVVAQSASEFSLACDFTKPGVVAIGSLISFRKMDAPEHKRALGVVSKMLTFKQDTKINVEMDVLAGQFYAVGFEYLEEKKHPQRKKALLYGVKEQGKEEKSFIIMESFMLKEGDIIRMFMQDEDYPIILKDRKNIGLGYWQFECRKMLEARVDSHNKQGYDFI
jgi:hypothetical protein